VPAWRGIAELLRQVQILFDGDIAELLSEPRLMVLVQMGGAEALAHRRRCEPRRQREQCETRPRVSQRGSVIASQ